MIKKPNIFAMIPARMSSTRLLMKNLALLNGKPLISYAIQSAKRSGVFNEIYINSENPLFSKIAKRYGVEYYKRPSRLATSNTKSDFVVYDFIKNNPCDILAWVNSIAPLQNGAEIRNIVGFFIKNRLDSLITVKNEQVHCIYKDKPVNFNLNDIFSKTQDLLPVQPFVYSVMMWRTEIFMRAFEKKGHAFFCGKTGFYPVGKLSSIIIKRKEDLMIAESLLGALKKAERYKVKYDRLANNGKGRQKI